VGPRDHILPAAQLQLQKRVSSGELSLQQIGDGNDLVVLHAIGAQGNIPGGGLPRQKLGPQVNVSYDIQFPWVHLQLVTNKGDV